jgi:hypothetical protein
VDTSALREDGRTWATLDPSVDYGVPRFMDERWRQLPEPPSRPSSRLGPHEELFLGPKK